MSEQYTIAEAKNKLPSIVHSVESGPPVQLTRHGRPVAVLLSTKAYARLNRKKEGFWRSFKAFCKAAEKEDIQITDKDFAELRDSTSGRKTDMSW